MANVAGARPSSLIPMVINPDTVTIEYVLDLGRYRIIYDRHNVMFDHPHRLTTSECLHVFTELIKAGIFEKNVATASVHCPATGVSVDEWFAASRPEEALTMLLTHAPARETVSEPAPEPLRSEKNPALYGFNDKLGF